MSRPSFQFYPADHRNNSKLSRCSDAAQGAWMRVLCVLHDQDEYGVCRWPMADLARAAGVPLKLVKELAGKDVLKGADKNAVPYIYTPRHAGKDGAPVTLVESRGGPCWYCSRFVRDEWIRQRRGNSTQFSSDNQPPKGQPKPTPKGGIGERQGDGPSSSSSSSINTNTPIPPEGGSPAPQKKERKKREGETLQAFIDRCKAEGVKPIPADDSIFTYVRDVGLADDMLVLAWFVFKNRYLDPKKLQKDWRAHYRNAVKSNWFKLWFLGNDGTAGLTTAGMQAEREMQAKSRMAA